MNVYQIWEDNDSYRFVLLPRNNRNQPLGESIPFQSYKECEKAMESFRKYLGDEHKTGMKVTIEYTSEGEKIKGVIFRIYLKGQEIFYRRKPFTGASMRQNCLRCVKNICGDVEVDVRL